MSGMLEGRLALVTGSADGIGRGIVDLFTEQGAQVVATDIQAERLVAAHQDNPAVHTIALDITASDTPQKLRAFVEERLGGLDILVNNAGVAGDGSPIAETSEEAYRWIIAVNVDAPFRVTQAMVPLLKANRRGRVITTGSPASHVAMTGLGVYTISKHAVLGMMRAFAFEFGPLGITANNIEPGNTLTGLTRDDFGDLESPAAREFAIRTTALQAYTLPSDLAGAALYLASDYARLVSGQSIAVDAGMQAGNFALGLPDKSLVPAALIAETAK